MKPITFLGDSLDALRGFADAARHRAGRQLERVQRGADPDDWKPMSTVGPGTREIRVRDEHGAFRVVYVAKFAHTIFVLHCFHKKTQRTSSSDITLAAERYKALRREE